MLDRVLRDLVHGEFVLREKRIAFLDVLLVLGTTVAGVMIRKAIFGIAGNEILGGDIVRLLYCVIDFVLAAMMALFTWKTTKNTLKTVGIYALAVIWPAIAGNSALNGGVESALALVLVAMMLLTAAKDVWNKQTFGCVAVATCSLCILQSDDMGTKLTNCWPNIYTLFSETGFLNEYGETGKLLTFGILMIIFYYLWKKKFTATPKLAVSAGLFFSLLISAFYPFMNYRSGLIANVFALLLFVQDRKKFYVPVAMCIISYTSYGYFYGVEIGLVSWIYAIALIVLMLDAGVYFYRQIQMGNEG